MSRVPRAPVLPPSPIAPTVDYDADGLQHGFLRLPHSHDESAWGAIMIPIAVVKNGAGPTALLTGANHGDEYEGAIAMFKLASDLSPAEVTGRVIIVPAMNLPAFRAGRRTSPIDQANLNRRFPGRPDGSVTERIADYFQRHLLPLADYVLDLHSGGKSLEFVPFAAVHALEDKTQQARSEALMEAFGAPYSMVLFEMDTAGMYDTAAEAMGKIFVSTELGGGGTTTAYTVAIADRGVRNFLRAAGILNGAPSAAETIKLEMPDADCYVISESNGVLEPCVDLGQVLRAGQSVARVYDGERTGVAPREYQALRDGILVGRHFPGLVRVGDCIAAVAAEVDGT